MKFYNNILRLFIYVTFSRSVQLSNILRNKKIHVCVLYKF